MTLNIMQEVVPHKRSCDNGETPITPAGVQDELFIHEKSHALQSLTQSYGGYTQGKAVAFRNQLDALSSNVLYMSKCSQTQSKKKNSNQGKRQTSSDQCKSVSKGLAVLPATRPAQTHSMRIRIMQGGNDDR